MQPDPRNPVYIDFETYYGDDYSLRSMHTSAYIRDPRFKVHGVGVAIGNNQPVWLTGDAVPQLFASVDWSQIDVVGHNLLFDGLIMTHHYGVKPRSWIDTLGMSRAIIGGRLKSMGLDSVGNALGLGGKLHHGKALNDVKNVIDLSDDQLGRLGSYCIDDVKLTRSVYHTLRQAFPEGEYDSLSWTIEMGVNPTIEIDTAPLEQLAAEEKQTKRDLVKQTGLKQTQISSNKQFADILTGLGITPPTKVSATTGRETFAFSKKDEEFIDLLEHPDDKVVDLVEARLAVKSTIKESRAKSMTELSAQGPWALQLNYSGAVQTHRLSGGGGVNPQNLPRNMPDKPSLLRQALRAPDGRKLVAIDLSQIELRVNCAVSGQTDVLDRLVAGEDEYAHFASIVYGRQITKADKVERNVGKVGVLSLGYGSGAATFRTMLRGYGIRLSLDECKKIVKAYRQTYPYIKNSWSQYEGWLRAMLWGEVPRMDHPITAPITLKNDGFILPSGLHVSYPKLQRYDWQYRKMVNVGDNRYADGLPNSDGFIEAAREDIGYAYQNERKPVGVASIYGSKTCIAHGTPVLTDEGWVPIQDVTEQNLVWDGGKWVSHNGLRVKGERSVIKAYGVNMTPDHEVLTTEGWVCASQSEGYNRAESGLPDSGAVRWKRWEEIPVVVSLPVRETDQETCDGYTVADQSRDHAVMRVHETRNYLGKEQDPWLNKISALRGVASRSQTLQQPDRPSLGELRCAGDNDVRPVGGELRGVLAGHGADVCSGTNAGQDRQQRQLRAEQLPMGYAGGSEQQSAQQQDGGNTARADDHITSGEALWNQALDTGLQDRQQAEERVVQTYDIADCGPHNRFVVMGEDGRPLIVHNCGNICQSLARDVNMHYVKQLRKQIGLVDSTSKVVMSVHDESVIECAEEHAEAILELGLKIMNTPPAWWPTLPVAAEGSIGQNYAEAK